MTAQLNEEQLENEHEVGNKDMAPNEALQEATEEEEVNKPLTTNENEEGKIIFKGGGGGDVEMGGNLPTGNNETNPALSKTELLKYAKDPFWVKIRWTLFVLFWIVWIAMLVGSIYIIVQAPKCYQPEPKKFWQKGPIYNVYVKSYKDSNGDGLGDLKGLKEKGDYIEELGVGTVVLSKLTKTSNLETIDPDLGTKEDFEALIKDFNDRNIQVVIDVASDPNTDKLKQAFEYWTKLGVQGFRITKNGEKDWLVKVGDTLETFNSLELDTSDMIVLVETDEEENDFESYYKMGESKLKNATLVPLNSAMMSLDGSSSALEVQEKINNYMAKLPQGEWPNFVVGNFENPRIANRMTDNKVKLLTLITMMLPGSFIGSYGDEIGMKGQMAQNPMLWSGENNAGFSSGTPWTKIGNEFKEINVAKQIQQATSNLNFFKKMAEFRESDSVLFGEFEMAVKDNDVLLISRVKKGNPGYLAVANLGSQEKQISAADGLKQLPSSGNVMTRSMDNSAAVGSAVDMTNIILKPYEGLVINFVPDL